MERQVVETEPTPTEPPASPTPTAHAADTAGAGVGADRIALGTALQARADEVGELVDGRFAKELYGQAFATARLATFLISRWIATGEVASEEDEAVLTRQGEQAILEDASLGSVAKAYLAWRDCTVAVLNEEAHRLQVNDEVLALACDVVRFSSDGSLVRIVRQFDETRRLLQQRLDEEQASLAHQALHDQLTGLPNRALLTDRLGQGRGLTGARARPAPCCSTSTWTISRPSTIGSDMRRGTASSWRWPPVSRSWSGRRTRWPVWGATNSWCWPRASRIPRSRRAALAERIHLAMRSPVAMGERQLYTSVSIGIARVTSDANPEVNLSRADVAMYQAKRGGPARYECYNAAIGEDNRRQSHLAHELRAAYRCGQLAVHYQPLFRLGGEMVGMEALLRWDHPEMGSVPPVDFIPLLERSREIVPVGRWVLNEAVRQCRAWQEQGHRALTVSVNVSACQLQDPEFCSDVQTALARSGLDAGSLVLEVTESVLVVDVHRVGAIMQEIRDLGVHLALDDFGTGYSSLLYLQGLPIDRLKVDRSFVAGLGSPDQDPTIISTVVDLAHKLGLRVVAEGVETEAELRAVGAMGCDEAQGFLLARPAPAHSFSVADPVLSAR